MNCRYCSTELPEGALFCGECGRAVSSVPAPATATAPAASAPDVPASATADLPAAVAAPLERCAECGTELAPTDIFCGECGLVRASVAARRKPSDTNVLDPFPWGLRPEPGGRPAVPRSGSVTEELDVRQEAQVPPPPPGPAVRAGAPPVARAAAAASTVPPPLVVPPAPVSQPPAPPLADEPDLDETRIVDRSPRGERFVLQFSTGESVSVTGTGLIGRNPIAEPGEYFDTFVTIVDPGRSVSKTHLEFGQEGGAFWISDRYSGNGTVVREPDRQPKRSDPGKRYRIPRGSRVDIGEQFFIVS